MQKSECLDRLEAMWSPKTSLTESAVARVINDFIKDMLKIPASVNPSKNFFAHLYLYNEVWGRRADIHQNEYVPIDISDNITAYNIPVPNLHKASNYSYNYDSYRHNDLPIMVDANIIEIKVDDGDFVGRKTWRMQADKRVAVQSVIKDVIDIVTAFWKFHPLSHDHGQEGKFIPIPSYEVNFSESRDRSPDNATILRAMFFKMQLCIILAAQRTWENEPSKKASLILKVDSERRLIFFTSNQVDFVSRMIDFWKMEGSIRLEEAFQQTGYTACTSLKPFPFDVYVPLEIMIDSIAKTININVVREKPTARVCDILTASYLLRFLPFIQYDGVLWVDMTGLDAKDAKMKPAIDILKAVMDGKIHFDEIMINLDDNEEFKIEHNARDAP